LISINQETISGPHSEFDWKVDVYGFDLAVSNIFFFWLKEGGPENLRAEFGGDVFVMSSAYFYITQFPAPDDSDQEVSDSGNSVSSTKSFSSTTTHAPTPTPS